MSLACEYKPLVKHFEQPKHYRCHFCNGNHSCRECPIELAMSPQLNKIVGKYMEHWIADNYNCPECDNPSLCVRGDNAPSSDLICSSCKKQFEVKSKCLSSIVIPNDIKLNHGSWKGYIKRLTEEGLNLIVIIYGVNRKNKTIFIREILYANNDDLLNDDIIEVKECSYSTLSTILIKNKSYLFTLPLIKENIVISFKKDYDKFVKTLIK